MPYILKKTNGVLVASIDDAALDLTTNLTFIGRNYAAYGEVINENCLKLLENFSNTIEPTRPIMGQIWFDSTSASKRLNVCYDGTNFKTVANMQVQATSPRAPLVGDLWWDSSTGLLKAFNGESYVTIGPANAGRTFWISSEELSATNELTTPVLTAYIGKDPIAVISMNEFVPATSAALYTNFSAVKLGITLAGADSVTGSSKAAGYYFWGTAAEALVSDSATTAKQVTMSAAPTANIVYPTLVSSITGDNKLFGNSAFSYNATTNVLSTVASAARYADLAERYSADAVYDLGAVLVIGGINDVTVTTEHANTAVAGIVSKNPAYMMNSDAGTDETHPYIALKGRVPCKVVGYIEKGDLLVTSIYSSYATAWVTGDHPSAVIGKALESQLEGFGIIEVFVV